jgi:hypothetical protein
MRSAMPMASPVVMAGASGWSMPLAPTDPATRLSPMLPRPPTNAFPAMNGGMARSPYVPGSGYASPYAASRPAAPELFEKPFANTRSSPAVSPYMNLFRNDTNGGTVNNYNTFVVPQLDQGRFNQRVAGQIGGLRMEGMRGQGVNTGTEVPMQQGIVNPQYYLNYQALGQQR